MSRCYIDDFKSTGTVDERIASFEKLGIPYVSYETIKPDGNKVQVVIRTDMPDGKKLLGKKAFANLYK